MRAEDILQALAEADKLSDTAVLSPAQAEHARRHSRGEVTEDNYLEAVSKRVFKNNINLTHRANDYSAFLHINPTIYTDLEICAPVSSVLGQGLPNHVVTAYCREIPAHDREAELLCLVGIGLFHSHEKLIGHSRFVAFITRVPQGVLWSELFNRNMPVTSVAFSRITRYQSILNEVLPRTALDLLWSAPINHGKYSPEAAAHRKRLYDNQRGIPEHLYVANFVRIYRHLLDATTGAIRPPTHEGLGDGNVQVTTYMALRKGLNSF